MTAAIYKIINVVNNKFYVGSTVNPVERFRTHRKRLRRNSHHCTHLQAAWNKYGESAFVFAVVEQVPNVEELQAKENIWLAQFVGTEQCYNKSKFSDAPMRGRIGVTSPNYGKKHSAEARQKISDARKAQACPRTGSSHTDKTKEKIRQAKLANPTKAWLGKERDEATRKKIGDAQRGVKKPPRKYTPEGLEKARTNMRNNARAVVPLNFSEVMAKFPESVIDKYDFSAAVYTGAVNRITGCLCPAHGEFSQYAAQFRKGRGCPKCGDEQRAQSKKKQMLECWATEEGRKLFRG